MNLLAIDTATESCSVALSVERKIISRFELAPRRHNRLILNMAQSLLSEAGLSLRQLDGIAFGRGPGSFTGVRIAASVVQGLAFGLDIPVIPISTLQAMAHQAWRLNMVSHSLVAIDARMGEVYWAACHVEQQGRVDLLTEEVVISPDAVSIPDDLMAYSWHALGTGWKNYTDRILEHLGVDLLSCESEWFPHSHDIVAMAQQLLDSGQGVSGEMALPVYLRNQVAKKPD